MKRLLPLLLLLLVPSTATAQNGWRASWVPSQDVHSAVQKLRDPLYRCYMKYVPEASREHGDIATLKVVIGESGNVFRVDFLEGSTRSKKFESCLRGLFEGLTFQKPSEKTTFVQKIGFQNGLDKMLIEPPRAAGGAITKESVIELATARQAEIQACYKTALASNPKLRGQLLVEIVVDGSRGTVTSAKVAQSTLNDSGVESCVLGVVRSFAFGVPDDPGLVILQFPLTFDDDKHSN